jgi:hypothetical protein
MPEQELATRQCPFCKEEIKVDAIRCKHCKAMILPERPTHHGVCPFCKESINPEAIRCKHCQANLSPSDLVSFFHERSSEGVSVPFQITSRTTLRQRIIFALPRARKSADNAGAPNAGPTISHMCDDCPPGWMKGSTMIGLVACDEEWCYYDEVGYV